MTDRINHSVSTRIVTKIILENTQQGHAISLKKMAKENVQKKDFLHVKEL